MDAEQQLATAAAGDSSADRAAAGGGRDATMWLAEAQLWAAASVATQLVQLCGELAWSLSQLVDRRADLRDAMVAVIWGEPRVAPVRAPRASVRHTASML